MSLLSWLTNKKKQGAPSKPDQAANRRSFAPTVQPVVSPRRRRRVTRREQLFTIVRESMIRGGVLSTSYQFKVLTLDATGDSFLVLIDLALPAESMPDEYLAEIERWIQDNAQSRHDMGVRSVYWRRKAIPDPRGMALKAAAAAQTGRQQGAADGGVAFPLRRGGGVAPVVQAVDSDEIEAFRRALLEPPALSSAALSAAVHLPVPESHSDFSGLSATQPGRL